MRQIESIVSPFIQSQFPAFYREEGPNFIAFLEAYYEWLEQNYQHLTLDDASDFEVGDMVQQTSDSETSTGVIEAKTGNTILVKVNSYEPFRDKRGNILSEIKNQEGTSTYISNATSLNPLYRGRNVLNFRDVDNTVDEFILQFKEKYLKNIQFNTATNKQLLIKNSLDLYRSKGTERAIDLFFRLVYGVQAEVYYPGDDLFKLSDGEWVVPKYLEISSSTKSIGLVGKQITGTISGASAFVEKYIVRKVQNGTVNILYLSNISGDFQNGEPLKADIVYSDSPKVVGSLARVEVITGGKTFSVGDIVSFSSTKGKGGLARVSSVTNQTGVVDFELVEGGFGFTSNADAIVSEKVLTISNVVSTNTEYFTLLEDAVQPLANITFGHANGLFTDGDQIYRYNGANVEGQGIILSHTVDSNTANGILNIAVISGSFPNGSNVYSTGNSVVANVVAFTDQTVTAKIMGIPNSAFITVSTPSGMVSANQEIYINSGNVEIANARIESIKNENSNYILEVSGLNGVFTIGSNVTVRDSGVSANVSNIILNFGVYNIDGSFTNAYSTGVYANISGTSGNLISVSSGFGADFRVSSLGETETIFINVDLLSANNGDPNTSFAYTDSGRKTLSVASNSGFQIGDSVRQNYSIIGFDPSVAINATSGFITLPSANANFAVGDYVWYSRSSGNTTPTGLANPGRYYVYHANSTGISLACDYQHTQYVNSMNYQNFCNNVVSETGHFLQKRAYGIVTAIGSGSVTVKGAASYVNGFSVTGGTANTTTYANNKLFVTTDLIDTTSVNTNITAISAAASANVANQEFMTVMLGDYAYGFDKNVNGDVNDIIFTCLDFRNFEIGVITAISTADPGIDYNVDPFVLVYEQAIAGQGRRDLILDLSSSNGNFIEGERVFQTSESLTYYNLTVADETNFVIGEQIYQGTLGSATANATITEINANSNIITVNNVEGTLANTTIHSYISSANTTVTDIDLFEMLSTAKGIVKSSNNTIMDVKRITYNNTFKAGETIIGQSSGATATIEGVQENQNSLPIGMNAQVSANVITANGYVTSLDVVDSGYGYSNAEIVNFVSEDSEESGLAKLILDGDGTGSGYFKSSKGFISANKYLIDSDYYQEYSYEVLTRLPFDTYADVFKKVLHTAGTKLFGSVVITEEEQALVGSSESEITVS